MKQNLFLIHCHDVEKNEWFDIPRFRALMPFKNPSWFIKHKDLMDVCDWIEINICTQMESLTYPTLGVLVRISTGMIFKCELSKDDKIALHDNLIRNVYDMFYKRMGNELPFLGIDYWFSLYPLCGYCIHNASDTLINS